jgi:hypothetical protein
MNSKLIKFQANNLLRRTLTIQIPRVRVAQLKNNVVFVEDKHNVLQETVNSMFYEKYVNWCFKPSVFSIHVHIYCLEDMCLLCILTWISPGSSL